jgi:hypothetical protein
MRLTYKTIPNLMFLFTRDNSVTFLSLCMNLILLPSAVFVLIAVSGILLPTTLGTNVYTYVILLGLTIAYAIVLGLVPKKMINEDKRVYLFFLLVTITPFISWYIFVKFLLV